MATCTCPTCGSRALQIDRYQETATYHCGQCGTLATQANAQPVLVRCVPVRTAAAPEALPDLLGALKRLRTACRDKYGIGTRNFAQLAGISPTQLCEWTSEPMTEAPDLVD